MDEGILFYKKWEIYNKQYIHKEIMECITQQLRNNGQQASELESFYSSSCVF